MAAIQPPETDPVSQLLRRRPPAAALGWAAAAFGPGSRVVSVRPLSSAWLANHAVEVADAAGAVHRVVLRRWARPGWDEEDPDFTAAREAAILDLLAPTPVPAPALLAADPGATVCDVPALLLALLPGGPPDLRGDPGRLVEGLAAALPPIHAVAVPAVEPASPGRTAGPGPSRPPPVLRPGAAGPAGLVDPARAVAAGLRGGRRAAAGRPRLLHPPRLPPGQHPLDRGPAHRGGRLDRRVVGAALGRPRAHAGQPGRRPRAGGGRPVPGRPPGPDRLRPRPVVGRGLGGRRARRRRRGPGTASRT